MSNANGLNEAYIFEYNRGKSEFVRFRKYGADADDDRDNSQEFIQSLNELSICNEF